MNNDALAFIEFSKEIDRLNDYYYNPESPLLSEYNRLQRNLLNGLISMDDLHNILKFEEGRSRAYSEGFKRAKMILDSKVKW